MEVFSLILDPSQWDDVKEEVASHLSSTMEYRPGTPPPVYHVLRPHHIDLIAVFLLVFKEFHNNLPQNFLLFIYRFLLFEVSEVGLLPACSRNYLILSGRATKNPSGDPINTTICTGHRLPQCPESPHGL